MLARLKKRCASNAMNASPQDTFFAISEISAAKLLAKVGKKELGNLRAIEAWMRHARFGAVGQQTQFWTMTRFARFSAMFRVDKGKRGFGEFRHIVFCIPRGRFSRKSGGAHDFAPMKNRVSL